MVVADVDEAGFTVLAAEKEVVRLGEGSKGLDHLSISAIDRFTAAVDSAAIMVNASRETVTRALARLKADGIIQKDMRRLIIRRPDRLRQLVEKHEAPLE